MTKKTTANTIDFDALQAELETINAWFETNKDSNPQQALNKYRRSVAIVKEMKAYLAEVENEFKVITQELQNDES